jgi:hypothetical protein
VADIVVKQSERKEVAGLRLELQRIDLPIMLCFLRSHLINGVFSEIVVS